MKHRINSEPKETLCYSTLSTEKYSCVSYRNRRKPSCKVQEATPSVTGSRGRNSFSAACRQGMCSNLLCFWHSWISLFPNLDSPHQTKHFVSHTLWAAQFIWQSGEFSLFMWIASLHLSQKYVTMYPELTGYLLLNWIKPLALKDLVHIHCIFQFLRKRDETSTKQWQKLFMKCNFCESQCIKIMRHWCHEHILLLCPRRKSSVEIYNDSAFLETARIFFHFFFFFQNSAY